MTYVRLLPYHLAFVSALGGCSGSVYPVGSEEHSAGGSAAGGSRAAGGATSENSGGNAASGGGSQGAGGSNPSAGGASSSIAGASTGAGIGGSANTGGAANTGGNATNTSGTAVSIGGTSNTGGNAPSTGGAANTGGNSADTGGTPNSGGNSTNIGGNAPTTGGAATGAGGSAPGTGGGSVAGGVQSRVVVVDPSAKQFSAYDSEGHLVHDYTQLLEFDSSFDDRIVCIDWAARSWDGRSATPYFASVDIAAPGKFPPMAANEIFVRARRVGGGSVNVRIAATSGAVSDELTVTGDWEVFESSPSRKYILGGTQGSSGVLVRRSDRAIVWQGPLFGAAFSPDDQHLIVRDGSYSTALTIVETSTGHTTPVKVTSLPTAFTTGWASVEGATNSGAIVSLYRGDSQGQPLFWVTWDGAIKPFDATLPPGVVEYVLRTSNDDSRIAWWRNQDSSSNPVDESLLGWFELDIASMTNRRLPELETTDGDCYASTTNMYYKIDGRVLLACNCDSANCTNFASSAEPQDSAWMSNVSVSPQGGIIGYNYDWSLNRMPESTPQAQLYYANGARFALVDAGRFQYDRLDKLAIAMTFASTNAGVAIVSASTGKVTPLASTSGTLKIVYE